MGYATWRTQAFTNMDTIYNHITEFLKLIYVKYFNFIFQNVYSGFVRRFKAAMYLSLFAATLFVSPSVSTTTTASIPLGLS